MKKNVTFGALLAVLAGAACGQDLLLVHAGVDDSVLIDRASISRSGSNAEAWVVHSFDRRVAATEALPAHRSIRIRMVFDCRRQSLGAAERTLHENAFGRGKAVSSWRSNSPPALAPPASGTERALLAIVCER